MDYRTDLWQLLSDVSYCTNKNKLKPLKDRLKQLINDHINNVERIEDIRLDANSIYLREILRVCLNKEKEFSADHYKNRLVWVTLIAPVCAALLAGYVSYIGLNQIKATERMNQRVDAILEHKYESPNPDTNRELKNKKNFSKNKKDKSNSIKNRDGK